MLFDLDQVEWEWLVDTMRMVVEETKDLYLCNRPPGAAGAAIFTRAGNMVITGVGPTNGSPSCKSVGCEIDYTASPSETGGGVGALHEHCVRTIHAEQKAIAMCAKYGYATDGAHIFSILKPCYHCSKLIIAAGIQRIYYAGMAYDEERTRIILNNAKMTCIRIDIGLGYGNG